MEKVKKEEHGGESRLESFRKLFKNVENEEEQLLDEISTRMKFWKIGPSGVRKEIRDRLLRIDKEFRIPAMRIVAQLYAWSPEAHIEVYKAVVMSDMEFSDKIRKLYDNTKLLTNAGAPVEDAFPFVIKIADDTKSLRKVAKNIKTLRNEGVSGEVSFLCATEFSVDVVNIVVNSIVDDIKILKRDGVSADYAAKVSFNLVGESRIAGFEKTAHGIAEAEKSGLKVGEVSRILVGMVDEGMIEEFNKNPAEFIKKIDLDREQLPKRINFKSHFLDRKSSKLKERILDILLWTDELNRVQLMRMIVELCDMSRQGGYLEDMRHLFYKEKESHGFLSDNIKKIYYATKRLTDAGITIKPPLRYHIFHFIENFPDFSTTDTLIKNIEILKLRGDTLEQAFTQAERLLDTPAGSKLVSNFEILRRNGISAGYAASFSVELASKGYAKEIADMAEGISKAERSNLEAKSVVEIASQLRKNDVIIEFNKNPAGFIKVINRSAQKLEHGTKIKDPLGIASKIVYEIGPAKANKVIDSLIEISNGKLVYPTSEKLELDEAQKIAFNIVNLQNVGLDENLAAQIVFSSDELTEKTKKLSKITDVYGLTRVRIEAITKSIINYVYELDKDKIGFWLDNFASLIYVAKSVSPKAVIKMFGIIERKEELENFDSSLHKLLSSPEFGFDFFKKIEPIEGPTYRIEDKFYVREQDEGTDHIITVRIIKKGEEKKLGYLNFESFFTEELISTLAKGDLQKAREYLDTLQEKRKNEILNAERYRFSDLWCDGEVRDYYEE